MEQQPKLKKSRCEHDNIVGYCTICLPLGHEFKPWASNRPGCAEIVDDGAGGGVCCHKPESAHLPVEALNEQYELLSFARLRIMNVRRCIRGFHHTLESWSVAEWTNAMIGEAGEACNIAKKMLRHRDNVAGNRGDDLDLVKLRGKLARELADAIIYADLVAASQGINLGAAVRDTFNTKSDEIGAEEKL